jgi:hypothetical protein
MKSPKSEPKKPKTKPKQRRAVNKKPAFLAAYRLTASLTEAAKAIPQDRTQHYNWLANDAKYAAAFELAKIEAAELLEDECVRRALVGVLKPVFYQGQPCGAERVFSDGLAMFLLRGMKPAKYRQQTAVELTGAAGGPVELSIVERLNAARNRLAAAHKEKAAA